MRKKFVLSFMLAALLLAVTVISASAAVTVNKNNYVYDVSFDLALVNNDSRALTDESNRYQYTSGDVEDDEFYSALPNPGNSSGGEILSVFSVYGVTSPDLINKIDKVKYLQVPEAIGNEAALPLFCQ